MDNSDRMIHLPQNFTTTRDKILIRHEQANQPVSISSAAHRSTLPFHFDVVDMKPANDDTATMGHLVCRAGQVLRFFSYGQGDPIPTGHGSATRNATEIDTTLPNARRIVGEVALEGLTATSAGTLVEYASTIGADLVTDQAAKRAYQGLTPMTDPAAIAKPRQCDSPMNLEDMIWAAIRPHCLVQLEYGNGSRIVKLGTLDELPTGAVQSYLRTLGEPVNGNRYAMPEGHLLTDDKAAVESEFAVVVTVARDVVIPFQPVIGLFTATSSPKPARPTSVALLAVLRIHGPRITVAAGSCA